MPPISHTPGSKHHLWFIKIIPVRYGFHFYGMSAHFVNNYPQSNHQFDQILMILELVQNAKITSHTDSSAENGGTLTTYPSCAASASLCAHACPTGYTLPTYRILQSRSP